MSQERKDCPLDLTDDEIDGINWLLKTLKAIRKKGPSHRSYKVAMSAVDALYKLRHLREMHEEAHQDAEPMSDLDYAEIKMMIQERGSA
jgi:hypothetical protein